METKSKSFLKEYLLPILSIIVVIISISVNYFISKNNNEFYLENKKLDLENQINVKKYELSYESKQISYSRLRVLVDSVYYLSLDFGKNKNYKNCMRNMLNIYYSLQPILNDSLKLKTWDHIRDFSMYSFFLIESKDTSGFHDYYNDYRNMTKFLEDTLSISLFK